MGSLLLLAMFLVQGAEPAGILKDPKFADTLNTFITAPESAQTREQLERLLALYPADPNGLMEVGRQLLMRRDPKHAEEFLRRAVERSPDVPQTHFAMGVCWFKLEKYDLSEKSFRRALELSPDAPDITYNLAQALGSQRKIDEAEKLFRKAAEMDPDRAQFRFSLGEALMHVGKNEEAIVAFKAAAELGKALKYPDDNITRGRALYDLGYMLGLQDRHSEASACFEESLKELPNDTEAHAQYGIYLYRQKKYEQALVQLRQAVQLGPRHRQANYHLALSLKQLGNLTESEVYLNRFKQLQTQFEKSEREAILEHMQENLRGLDGQAAPSDKTPEKKGEK
jgi:tetratricopeptide (TPR) repeat protein